MKCCECLKEYPQTETLGQFFSFSTPSLFQICFSCKKKYQKLSKKRCQGCSKSLKKEEPSFCLDCRLWQKKGILKPPHEAIFSYDEAFKQWIEQFKFKGAYHFRFSFVEEIRDALVPYNTKNYLFVPIPLSLKQKENRKYNQVSACLKASQLPYKLLLKKNQETLAQVKKTRKERLLLSEDSFSLTTITKEDQKKKIILIDDVYTTGTTLLRATQVLKKGGINVVKTFSFAR